MRGMYPLRVYLGLTVLSWLSNIGSVSIEMLQAYWLGFGIHAWDLGRYLHLVRARPMHSICNSGLIWILGFLGV